MRLLVSVATATDAAAALAGGADFIDAKDPSAGALGAVTLPVLHEIASTVSGARPMTAALGDAEDEASLDRAAREYSLAGAQLVKVGFAGISSRARVNTLLRAAAAASAGRAGVIAAAYADHDRAASPSPYEILDAAATAGAIGILLDTADKNGPGLRSLMALASLASWVATAHDAGLLVALAGKLALDDLEFVREAGADVAGVRGAACDGGRAGHVVTDRVRRLLARARRSALALAPDPVAACE
jgi:uncharacterized protein (UPF0264 family)